MRECPACPHMIDYARTFRFPVWCGLPFHIAVAYPHINHATATKALWGSGGTLTTWFTSPRKEASSLLKIYRDHFRRSKYSHLINSPPMNMRRIDRRRRSGTTCLSSTTTSLPEPLCDLYSQPILPKGCVKMPWLT